MRWARDTQGEKTCREITRELTHVWFNIQKFENGGKKVPKRVENISQDNKHTHMKVIMETHLYAWQAPIRLNMLCWVRQVKPACLSDSFPSLWPWDKFRVSELNNKQILKRAASFVNVLMNVSDGEILTSRPARPRPAHTNTHCELKTSLTCVLSILTGEIKLVWKVVMKWRRLIACQTLVKTVFTCTCEFRVI